MFKYFCFRYIFSRCLYITTVKSMFLYIICFTYEYLILVIFYTFKGGVTLSG